ncbi:MAG: MGMT family protein, partial [Treponema sp.]|nr:MGMT family protein [Treponema sp.]
MCAIIYYMKVFSLAERIYAAVRLIPRGKVASYSQIAALAGNCNLRRYVGNALHK